jgi:glycerol-3-phosphate acyltransferase PlsY
MMLGTLLAVVAAYLLGSIPSAYLITRWRLSEDVRNVGDGNAGARNVWHMVGPGWGILVGAVDVAKGATPVLLAAPLGASPFGSLLVGPVAILGHDYPLYRRFRGGGKGLATATGVLLARLPVTTLAALALFGVGWLLMHSYDRAIVVGAGSAILLPVAFGEPWSTAAYVLLIFCLLWARKLQDLAHERRVWSRSGWTDAEDVAWYGPPPTDEGKDEVS